MTPKHSIRRIGSARRAVGEGPLWDGEQQALYFVDLVGRALWRYTPAQFDGFPDGATVDADSNLWAAVCPAGKIVCYRADATAAQVIDVPVRGITSVMFGGQHPDEPFFSSISNPLLNRTDDDPSGGLFVITGLQAQGLPEPRFGG